MINEKTIGILMLVVVLLVGFGGGWLFKGGKDKSKV